MSYHAESLVVEPVGTEDKKELKAWAYRQGKSGLNEIWKANARDVPSRTIVTTSGRENRDVKTVIERYVRP